MGNGSAGAGSVNSLLAKTPIQTHYLGFPWNLPLLILLPQLSCCTSGYVFHPDFSKSAGIVTQLNVPLSSSLMDTPSLQERQHADAELAPFIEWHQTGSLPRGRESLWPCSYAELVRNGGRSVLPCGA